MRPWEPDATQGMMHLVRIDHRLFLTDDVPTHDDTVLKCVVPTDN